MCRNFNVYIPWYIRDNIEWRRATIHTDCGTSECPWESYLKQKKMVIYTVHRPQKDLLKAERESYLHVNVPGCPGGWSDTWEETTDAELDGCRSTILTTFSSFVQLPPPKQPPPPVFLRVQRRYLGLYRPGRYWFNIETWPLLPSQHFVVSSFALFPESQKSALLPFKSYLHYTAKIFSPPLTRQTYRLRKCWLVVS